MGEWRHDVLLRELSRWEAVSSSHVNLEKSESSASWFAIRETISRLTHKKLGHGQSQSKAAASNDELAEVITQLLWQACDDRSWVVVQGGARFVQVLIGLFPDTVSMPKSKVSGECADS